MLRVQCWYIDKCSLIFKYLHRFCMQSVWHMFVWVIFLYCKSFDLINGLNLFEYNGFEHTHTKKAQCSFRMINTHILSSVRHIITSSWFMSLSHTWLCQYLSIHFSHTFNDILHLLNLQLNLFILFAWLFSYITERRERQRKRNFLSTESIGTMTIM